MRLAAKWGVVTLLLVPVSAQSSDTPSSTSHTSLHATGEGGSDSEALLAARRNALDQALAACCKVGRSAEDQWARRLLLDDPLKMSEKSPIVRRLPGGGKQAEMEVAFDRAEIEATWQRAKELMLGIVGTLEVAVVLEDSTVTKGGLIRSEVEACLSGAGLTLVNGDEFQREAEREAAERKLSPTDPRVIQAITSQRPATMVVTLRVSMEEPADGRGPAAFGLEASFFVAVSARAVGGFSGEGIDARKLGQQGGSDLVDDLARTLNQWFVNGRPVRVVLSNVPDDQEDLVSQLFDTLAANDGMVKKMAPLEVRKRDYSRTVFTHQDPMTLARELKSIATRLQLKLQRDKAMLLLLEFTATNK